MAVPYIPLGISAGVLGLLLWSRTASAATSAGSDKGPEKVPQGGGTIPVDPRMFPPGTAVGIVVVKASDPGLEGRQPGVRINNQPKPRADGATQASPGSTGDEIPSGERVAVLSDEITDTHGRKWRQVRTIKGITGYAAFVDPDGVTQNIIKAPESTPWPGEGGAPRPQQEIPIAGRPAFGTRIGACPPYPYGLGWTPWGAGWAPQVDIVGQAPAPGAQAVCTRECWLYGPMERGRGWTVTQRLPAGTVVRLAPRLPFPIAGPGSNYVLAQAPNGAIGWISLGQLRAQVAAPLPPPVRPRPIGPVRANLPGSAIPFPGGIVGPFRPGAGGTVAFPPNVSNVPVLR